MKVDMMRRNPEVCFEVDTIQNIFNWKSVIAWGKFKEITRLHDKEAVMQKISDKVMAVSDSETAHPSHGITAAESDVGTRVELILYKITLREKTGRFESR